MYKFNEQLSDREKVFKLSEAILVGETLEIIMLIKATDYDSMLDDALKCKVETVIRSIVPESIKIKVKYKKTICEKGYITRCVMDYFLNEQPLVYPKISGREVVTEVEYDTVKITMKVPQYILSFVTTNNIAEKIEAHLETKLMEMPIVEFLSANEDDEIALTKRRKPTRQEIAKKTRKMDITMVEDGAIIGNVVQPPKYISDVLGADSQQETVCGKVAGLATRTSKKSGKNFFVFKLNDTNAVIDVRYFPRFKSQEDKFVEKIQNGIEVVVEGQIVMDNYSGKRGMFMSRLALCKINLADEVEIDESERNIIYDDYLAVTPEKFEDVSQAGIYDTKNEIAGLKGTYVVFDFETTGLNAMSDAIIEIGACKMVDGTIVEQFGSLVNPERHIPEASTRVHGITDEDVADAPDLGDMVADFYKFSQGSTLVAHNADFDIGFLKVAGKQFGYDFTHPVVDTLAYARQLVNSKSHKLGDLCTRFGIELNNAHRAVHDAVATARLFRKLREMEEQ